MYLVTIICLAHNQKDYISDAIDGFLMQKTSFPVEIIIHDDCSTDGTADILRSYEAKHSNKLHCIYQTHNHYAESIQTWDDFLFSKAKGKYIAVSDGDDYWTDPYKLQKQVDILEADPTLMACVTGCSVVDKDKNMVQEQMSVVPGNKSGRYSIREFLLESHGWPVTTVVYRNTNREAVLQRNIKMENDMFGDWTMWVALLCDGDYYFLNEITAAYRINPTSQTHTDVDKRRMGQAKLNFRLMPIVADLLPEGYEDVKYNLLHNTAWMWWSLANAYKHEHKYFRMSYCLIRYVIKSAYRK